MQVSIGRRRHLEQQILKLIPLSQFHVRGLIILLPENVFPTQKSTLTNGRKTNSVRLFFGKEKSFFFCCRETEIE